MNVSCLCPFDFPYCVIRVIHVIGICGLALNPIVYCSLPNAYCAITRKVIIVTIVTLYPCKYKDWIIVWYKTFVAYNGIHMMTNCSGNRWMEPWIWGIYTPTNLGSECIQYVFHAVM